MIDKNRFSVDVAIRSKALSVSIPLIIDPIIELRAVHRTRDEKSVSNNTVMRMRVRSREPPRSVDKLNFDRLRNRQLLIVGVFIFTVFLSTIYPIAESPAVRD